MLEAITKKIEWRCRFLVGRNPFPVRQRLAYIKPWGERLDMEKLLDRCHGVDAAGEYYALDGFKIYYRPYGQVDDEARMVWGAKLILREAVLSPEEASPEVAMRPGDVVLDLGGNMGTSAMKFSRRVGPRGKVYSFEPVIPELIEKNARANGLANVTVVPMAVGKEEGEATFTVGDAYVDSSMARPPSGKTRQMKVKVTTIDRFVEEQALGRVDVIKVDIEGAEELAIRGATETVRRFRPKWTISSYHTDHEGEKQHPKLVRLLKEMGYAVREHEASRIEAWDPAAAAAAQSKVRTTAGRSAASVLSVMMPAVTTAASQLT